MLIVVAGKLQYGDVPKRLKGPHSKCGRSETAQGFKSLHLREKTPPGQSLGEFFYVQTMEI